METKALDPKLNIRTSMLLLKIDSAKRMNLVR
jgi:hypothetical protein